jgi:hypothetical protein
MVPDVSIPELDLGRIRQLDGDAPRAILEVLVEGLEHVANVRRGCLFAVDDDSPGRTSTFTYGPDNDRKTLPARKARDAWRLAEERGLVPAGWSTDPRRCFPDQELLFFCDSCDGMGATGYNYDDLCDVCGGRGNTMTRGNVDLPTSLDEVRWLLAHADVVQRAEALAREAVRRLGDDAPKPERIQWGRVRHGKPLGTVGVIITSPIWDHSRVSDWDWDRMKGRAFTKTPWYPEARKLPELTREILCFDVGMAWTHRARGVESSPFEPLLRMWELGVMMEELTPEKIVLERARHRYIKSWRAGMPYG